MSIDQYGFEVAKIYFKLRLKVKNKVLAEKISLEAIRPYLYDPLVKNKDVINKKLNHIIQLNLSVNNELDRIYPKLTQADKNQTIVELDFLKLSEEKDKLVHTNNNLTKQLSKVQNYQELPIQLEMQMQSEQGIFIVKKKFAILLNQIQNEKNRRKIFENEFKGSIPEIFKTNFAKNKLLFIEKAYNELEFNIKRYKDMIPLVNSCEQRFQDNKNIIENLEKNISFYYKENKGELSEVNNQITKLSLEKNVLLEKKKQFAFFDGLFNKELSEFEKRLYYENKMKGLRSNKEAYELEVKTNIYNFSTAKNIFEQKMFEEIKRKEKQKNFEKIVSNDSLMTKLLKETEDACIQVYQNRIKDLNNQAYQLFEQFNYSKKNEENNFANLEKNLSAIDNIYYNNNNNIEDNEFYVDEKKEFLINEIDVLENKEKILLDELNFSCNYFEEQVKSLKNRLAELEN